MDCENPQENTTTSIEENHDTNEQDDDEDEDAWLSKLNPPRTSSEACRDSLLRFLDTPLVQGIGILAIVLVIIDGAFFFFLLVGWQGMCDTPSRMDCDPRNKWYNLSIQGLNILFTYTNTVSMPWRCTQLLHISGSSCPPRENAVGHGLYGFADEPDIWYWIPLRKRLYITIILLNNCLMQYINQVTRIVYYDYESQNEFPGNIWTNVFFVASFACGGVGAAWMLYEMGKIRDAMPGKFGPGPIDSLKDALSKHDFSCCNKGENENKQGQDVETGNGDSSRRPATEGMTGSTWQGQPSSRTSLSRDPTRESQRRSLVGKGEGRAGPRLFGM